MDIADDAVQAVPKTVYLKDYTVPDYLVDAVELHFELAGRLTSVRSKLRMRRHPDIPGAPVLRLDGQDLELVSVALDGQRLTTEAYEVTAKDLLVPDVPETFSLEVETRIYPEANTALEGLYLSSGILCTQCEAEGFRRITYFPDRPDVLARYTVTLIADAQQFPVLLSNGNLLEQGQMPDGRHFACWQDPFPKPSYLFALVAGPLVCQNDSFITRSGREVNLHLYVEAENSSKCAHALASLKQAMQWDEEVYGREYDLDIYMIVAVNDFNMGAMENKGLNVFNAACVLASPETATDADYYNIQSIIGHEYFHNWSGNRVTCRDWFQLSLKEGFTVFRDQEFSADLNSRAVKRIDDVNVLRSQQFAEDAGPMAHPVRPASYIEISNFYTLTIYNKGAEVVRMIRHLVGTSGFRRGTDLYFARHDGEAVTTDDFVAAMEEANAIDLTHFRRWYSQAGTPELHITGSYDASAQTYTLEVNQSCAATPGQADKQALHIPLAIGLLDAHGNDLPLQLRGESGVTAPCYTHVLELRAQHESFCFENIPKQPVASLSRGFSAPVKIIAPRSDEELAFILAHDSDAFNRWDAAQQLAINTLLHLVEAHQAGQPLSLAEHVIESYRKVLNNDSLDQALQARLLSLPAEGYLADQCAVVDVDAIHNARQFMRRQLATALAEELRRVYEAHHLPGPYRFDATCMAKRALRNLCLAYLMEQGNEENVTVCLHQYHTAENMTDMLGALAPLSQYPGVEREAALQSFYAQWQHDPQVVDKWFSLQAVSHLPETLPRVKRLLRHPAFSLKNPNKVRALIGRFCQANPVRFHTASGEGYRFLADQVLALDALNPQIAARLVQALSRWRRYAPAHQRLMQEQLQRILEQTGLSKDVYEIVSKSLD